MTVKACDGFMAVISNSCGPTTLREIEVSIRHLRSYPLAEVFDVENMISYEEKGNVCFYKKGSFVGTNGLGQ